jgi:hypothetical protein
MTASNRSRTVSNGTAEDLIGGLFEESFFRSSTLGRKIDPRLIGETSGNVRPIFGVKNATGYALNLGRMRPFLVVEWATG